LKHLSDLKRKIKRTIEYIKNFLDQLEGNSNKNSQIILIREERTVASEHGLTHFDDEEYKECITPIFLHDEKKVI
ncbi:unnamed protein product, partial [Rotaria sp. Silwood2]